MKTAIGLALAAGIGLLVGSPAPAHFLFIHVTPPAEGGRAAEVYFSERAEAGDPKFIEKIAHAELWQQDAPGSFKALEVRKGADRLRAHLPEAGPVAVVGLCTYGVLARPKQTPFLLRYYPRAVAGSPDELNRLQQGTPKLPLEIRATFESDRIGLVLLSGGSPVPKAEFHTVDAELKNETLTADAEGKAWWKPSAAGRYCVYSPVITKADGDYKGQKFEEIREYPTLAFSWPLVRTGADPEAVALFEEAIASRAQWANFPGFTAKLAGRVDGRAVEGQVTIAADGTVTLEGVEEAVASWVQSQLESIAMHRAAGPARERPKPVLRFADAADDHPLGRLLIFDGGTFASSYRVKDRQILVVNRNLGKQNMTITVLENDRNADARFLPRSYTVQYWDAATGGLSRSETVQERWQRLGLWDLPVQHTVSEATAGGLVVRTVTLSDHQLLKTK